MGLIFHMKDFKAARSLSAVRDPKDLKKVEFDRGRLFSFFPPWPPNFGLTVLEVDFLRSANRAEIKNSKTKLMSGSSKMPTKLKYLNKQKSFISKY